MVNAYFKKFINEGIPFMQNAEKGNIADLANGEILHIIDFGFIRSKNGEFAVIAFKEYPHKFYFGGLALTDLCHNVDIDDMRDALANQGIVLSKRLTKDGRNKYMAYDFVDESEN